MKIKPLGKVIILMIVAGGAAGAYRYLSGGKGLGDLLPQAKTQQSVVPIKADLPVIEDSAPAMPVGNLKMPGTRVASGGTDVRWLLWAWNAHMGMIFANGGPQTTEGSLMAERGVNLSLTRQDDVSKMQEGLVEFATSLSRGNKQPDRGAHFVSIMGDGAATFLAALNDNLVKIGPEYKAKIIGAAGFSRGEDKFMGPKAWKDNPAKSKGGVVSGYLRDGDWNIAQKWLGDNGLKNNPDEKTYDPDALNWVSADDYIKAAEMYITGYTEERDVVRNGKRTGEKKRIKVDGVVTWTPGDVTIAEKKGGLVSIVSTKEYSAQMPCVIIGIDKWCKENAEVVTGMLEAIHRGGDAVKSSSAALDAAAKLSAVVYGEQDGAYWARYYKGAVEKDRTGMLVELGGSSVNNLTDNMYLFGLVPGAANTFAATYKVFGDIVKAQYPDLVPSYPPVAEILDTSYLRAAAKRASFSASTAAMSKPTPRTPGAKPAIKTVLSKRDWNIQFASGKATFAGASEATLNKLMNDLLVAQNTTVEIHGHTDNVGNADANMRLSEARAFAVRKWLERKAPRNFEGRIRVFAHGQTQPKESNGSDAGRARNRRVEIKIGTN